MQVAIEVRYTRPDGSSYLKTVNVNAVSRKHGLEKACKLAEREGVKDWEATILATYARTNREIWSEKYNGLLR